MQVEMTKKDYYIWLRKKKKISMQEIADHLGISKVAVHYYETGQTKEFSKLQEYQEFIDNF